MTTTAIVTGANGGIGKAIARQLAQKGFEVVMVCRDAKKGKQAVEDVIKATSNRKVSLELCDLSSYASVTAFTKRYRESKRPLHVLINNAAIVPKKKILTEEGLELQWATNVMSYYWLTEQLLDTLKSNAPSRIINVASRYAGDLDLSDVNFTKRRYDSNSAYRQTKQADRMLALGYSQKLSEYKVAINACHPGVVNTQVLDGLGFSGFESEDEGAATPVFLATSSEGGSTSGKWWVYSKAQSETFTNKKEIDQLFKLCSDFTENIKSKITTTTSNTNTSGDSSGSSEEPLTVPQKKQKYNVD